MFVLSVAAAAVLILMHWSVLSQGSRLIVEQQGGVQPVQAIIIPGSLVLPGKRVSHIVYDRLVRAAELYHAGKGQKVLISGDHGQTDYDEVNTIKHWLLKLDIPDEDIFMDHAGFSTYETVVRAKEIFQIESAVIVTQHFHLPRALYMAQKLGISVQGYPADQRNYTAAAHHERREKAARIKDFLFINLIRPEPTYLGKPIPITGDGRVTQD